MSASLRGIGIQNFKTYSEYQFCHFSALSFLIGKNGAGKSSFLQAAQLVFKFLEKANPKIDEIVDIDFKIVEIDKLIGDDFFNNYSDFTSVEQILNDPSKPIMIDLVLDFGYDKNSIVICPLKYRFIFSAHKNEQDLFLVLDEFKIENFLQNEIILTNNLKNWNEPYNISFTREGLVFLLSAFLKYLRSDHVSSIKGTIRDLIDKKSIKTKKEEYRAKYQQFEKEFLYEIDEVEFYQAIQQYGEEHGFIPNESIVDKVKLFIGGIEDYVKTDNERLREILNISYQSIKESFLEFAKTIKELETIKISEIGSRKRVLSKEDPFIHCFKEIDKISEEFLQNNLTRFKFNGLPTLEQISKDDKRFKVVLLKNDAKKINIIDEGSGYWILTYLILVLGNRANSGKIILVEEPETFLHPNFQANLADLFIEAVANFGYQIIIETHSEYLIKRLQRRVSQTKNKDKLGLNFLKEEERLPYDVKPSEISINYVHDKSQSNNIINISLDENGDLDQSFPPDFMDVSINEDLLSFKLKNLN